MEVPILKIPFDEADADFIGEHLRDMLLGGQLAMGRHSAAFEKLFAEFCGTPLALGCSNGTAALELICRALDVAGGSVAVPANTFMATALAPIAAGAKILLIDCDPVFFQMCPDDLERKIRPDTRAVILVHVGGLISPHWERIRAVCERNGAAFVEDAAHAHGAELANNSPSSGASASETSPRDLLLCQIAYSSGENDAFCPVTSTDLKGKTYNENRAELPAGRAGSLGRAAAFSFFPTKVLTTAEGGMVTTADVALYEAMRAIGQHGQERPGSNIHQHFGLNYRPSELHALLGLAMMKKADWILRRRRQAAALYDEMLAGTELSPVPVPPGQKPAYYKYMLLLPEGRDRAALKARLKDEFQVSLAGEVYAVSVGDQPLWAAHPEYLAGPLEPLPVSRLVAARQICLPLYPDITPEMQEYVVASLLRAL